MEIFQVPEKLGTTECEYSVVCSEQTNKVIILKVGLIPICDKHIRFYENH